MYSHQQLQNKTGSDPGLPDGLFSNQNPNLGKFLTALDWKIFIYVKAIWNILRVFGILYDHLVYFVFKFFSGFGIMCQEKSGNPVVNCDGIIPATLGECLKNCKVGCK
jgi:hypothetical protein